MLAAGGAAGALLPRPAHAGGRPGWIAAVTLIHGLPGRDEELKQHLLSLSGPTRAEPGCVAYDLYQDPEERHEFMRFEIWTSAEALEAHKGLPHLRASFEKRQREGWTTEILVWERVPG
jgi:quinol monooxygenase YgiN